MAMKKAPSRLEINKDIRRILVRHSVDTSKLNFTCAGKTITMYGGIYGEGGKELSHSNVDAVFKDIARLGLRVYCELENYTVSEGAVMKKATKEEEEKNNQQAKIREAVAKNTTTGSGTGSDKKSA